MPVHAVLVGKHVRSWLQFGRYVSDRENFLTMYFPGHGHYTRKFSDRYLEKKFPTPNFFRADYSTSSAIRQKNLVSLG